MRSLPGSAVSRAGIRVALLLVIFACSSVTAAEPTFDDWANAFADDWVRINPLLATRSQYFEGDERDALDRQLAPYTSWGDAIGADAANAQAVLARRGLAELERFRVQDLGPIQRASAALIRWRMQDVISGAEFATHRLVFQQMQDSLHLEIINALTQVHPIQTARDVENYLARVGQFSSQIDTGIANARAAQAAGVIPPRFILERTIAQFDELLNTPAGSNVLVTSLRERMSAMQEPVADARRAAYLNDAEQIVRDQLLPAFRRARDLLTAQLAPATDDAGVWRLPRGDEFYARQLAHFDDDRNSPRRRSIDRLARGRANRGRDGRAVAPARLQ